MDSKSLTHLSAGLFEEIVYLLEKTRAKAAVFLNIETIMLYGSIEFYIDTELKQEGSKTYGEQIVVTFSQQLTHRLSKGFSYLVLTRMQKVAILSQQLSCSRLIELTAIDSDIKRNFYDQLASEGKLNVRSLRNQIGVMLLKNQQLQSIQKALLRRV